MPPAARKRRDKPQAAIALVRISDDSEGRSVGVGRQEEDCRALAERTGWIITEVIVENDTSAYSTKRGLDGDGLPTRTTKRPEFRRALRQLNAGTNDGLIVYDIDRLARQPRDLEALIDLAEVSGTPVQSVTGSVDVSTGAGRAMSRVMVAFSSKSSEDTARRVARAARQRAEQGIPKTDGFRAYGYDRSMQVVPEEAAVIREVAARILAGEPVRAIANDLNARGVPPMRAAAWRNPAVKSIVRKATVAGLRSYTPHDSATRDEIGTTYYPGTWAPILDRETWEAVCATLAETAGTRTRGASERYLLSGLATCGACGARLYVGTGSRSKVYRCNECFKVSRSLAFVDERVEAVVLELLERDEVKAAQARRGNRRAPSVPARELEALRERRRGILREFATTLGDVDLREMLTAIDARITEVEARAGAGLAGVRLPRAVEYPALPLARRRAVVAALARVTVLPVGRGAWRDPESIRIEPSF